jgi:hypothetical protein
VISFTHARSGLSLANCCRNRFGTATAGLVYRTPVVALHDLGNSVLAHALTHLTQIAENAGRTISAAIRRMRLAEKSQQPVVVYGPLGKVVAPTTRNTHCATHLTGDTLAAPNTGLDAAR